VSVCSGRLRGSLRGERLGFERDGEILLPPSLDSGDRKLVHRAAAQSVQGLALGLIIFLAPSERFINPGGVLETFA